MDTLHEVDASTRSLLLRYGFDQAVFEQLRRRLVEGRAEEEHNRIRGSLDPLQAGDLVSLPPRGSRAWSAWEEAGRASLQRGEVCAVVLAGGMATRFGGVVKASVEVLPQRTFFNLKVDDLEQISQQVGTPLPVLLMTSFATDAEVTSLVRTRRSVLPVQTFAQFISLRLTPSGALFRDASGAVSPYAPGHGDLVYALHRADLLLRLRSQGVRYLFVSNVDNLAATLDPAVIGAHLARPVAMTFEVAPLRPGDKGGVPARVDGRLQVVEALRYPPGFVESSIPWFSINNFVLTLSALEHEVALDWFRVTKLVDQRPAIQFERLVNQLSAFVPSQALAVERDGLECRFLPVKDPHDLDACRPIIEALRVARGAR